MGLWAYTNHVRIDFSRRGKPDERTLVYFRTNPGCQVAATQTALQNRTTLPNQAPSKAAHRGDAPLAETTQFFSSLESLRGVAALLVVIFHAGWTNPITQSVFIENCALMVDFFFVLSGFVIYHSYATRLTGRSAVSRFLWLRLGRLYPIHLFFLFVFVALKLIAFAMPQDDGIGHSIRLFFATNAYAIVVNVLLLQSLGLLHSLTFNYPSWSISTEFYTYMLFAALRSVVRSDRIFIPVSILIVLGSGFILTALGFPTLVDATYSWGYVRCLGGFFVGVLTCHLYYRATQSRELLPDNFRKAISPIVLLLIGGFLAFVEPSSRATFLFPLLSAALIFSITRYANRPLANVLQLSSVRWLGRISYSVYMTHAAVNWVIVQFLSVVLRLPKIIVDGEKIVAVSVLQGVGLLVVYVVVVLLLSQITFYLIEDPVRLWSRRAVARSTRR